MQKLELHHEKELKGSFSLKKLNFLFVFQVNCPGCFFYGFPMVNKLYENYKNEVSFLGLSTAFEDFTLNTETSTKKLLENSELVGETKKAFQSQGVLELPFQIDFPIAMDAIADTSIFDYKKAALNICESNPNYMIWSTSEKEILLARVENYLQGLEKISKTFTINQLRGTPTFIIFNNDFEILFHQFGHLDTAMLKERIDELILKFN